MKGAGVQIEAPTRNTLCLCAYIATNIRPPRYMEAVDSLTAVIKNKPNDFEAVRCFRLCTVTLPDSRGCRTRTRVYTPLAMFSKLL
jgi:hypothetical protein